MKDGLDREYSGAPSGGGQFLAPEEGAEPLWQLTEAHFAGAGWRLRQDGSHFWAASAGRDKGSEFLIRLPESPPVPTVAARQR